MLDNAMKNFIEKEIQSNDIVLFMKGTIENPKCGFSARVVQILKEFHVDYKGIDVLSSDALRQGIKEYSEWPTIPQLYVKNEFIGGCDIICEMLQTKDLEALFKSKNIAFSIKNNDN